LPVRKSRLDSLFQQFNNIQTTCDAENANRCLCGLRNVKEIVKQRLVVMGTKEIKLLDDED
jgi:hypothetical protein